MNRITGSVVAIAWSAAWLPAAHAVQGDGGLPAITSQVYVSGFSSPLASIQDPQNPRVQFVVQQRGLIRVVLDGVVQGTNFLNLSAIVNQNDNEGGLLGLAFPPSPSDDRFYVYYTDQAEPAGHTHLVRYERMPGNPMQGDPNSAEEILFVNQPFSNHNGGNMAFGMDGYLYVGMGDGGSGGDPGNRAQTATTLLGKMLRIDVSPQTGYAVPADNPFVDNDPIDALEEIWAFGTRNPWRWSFDNWILGGDGALLMADVGQNAIEEVNYEAAGDGGNNYGWRRFEGNNLFSGGTPLAYEPHTPPIHTYTHAVGSSITGGYVYRGFALGSAFYGRYFFADFVSRRVWSGEISLAEGGPTLIDVVEHTTELGGSNTIGNIASFGEDAEGELYLVSFNGQVRKIVPQSPTTLTAASVLFGNLVAGGVPELQRSDNLRMRVRSRPGFALNEANLARVRVEADTTAAAPSRLDVSVETNNDTPGAVARIRIFNYDTNQMEDLGTFPLTTGDRIVRFQSIPNHAAYIRDSDGQVRIEVRHSALVVFSAQGFQWRTDFVSIAAP
jgi:glucose/arabinose dehydrogenase